MFWFFLHHLFFNFATVIHSSFMIVHFSLEKVSFLKEIPSFLFFVFYTFYYPSIIISHGFMNEFDKKKSILMVVYVPFETRFIN